MGSLLLCGLTSCQDFEQQSISSAEEAVKVQLKDPSSASFEDVRLVDGQRITASSRDMYTCGYVNARNSFGAMAGRTRFVVVQSKTTLGSRSYFSTHEAVLEDSLEKYEGTPASFDRLYWVHCQAA